jgi:hypothetical protein
MYSRPEAKSAEIKMSGFLGAFLVKILPHLHVELSDACVECCSSWKITFGGQELKRELCKSNVD